MVRGAGAGVQGAPAGLAHEIFLKLLKAKQEVPGADLGRARLRAEAGACELDHVAGKAGLCGQRADFAGAVRRLPQRENTRESAQHEFGESCLLWFLMSERRAVRRRDVVRCRRHVRQQIQAERRAPGTGCREKGAFSAEPVDAATLRRALERMDAAWPEGEEHMAKLSVNAMIGLWARSAEVVYSVRSSSSELDGAGTDFSQAFAYEATRGGC